MTETHRKNNDSEQDCIQEMAYLRLKYEQQLLHSHKSDYDLGYNQALEEATNQEAIHHYPEKIPSLSQFSELLTNGSFNNYQRGYQDGLAM